MKLRKDVFHLQAKERQKERSLFLNQDRRSEKVPHEDAKV